MSYKGFLAGVAASFLTVCGLSWAQGEPTYQLVEMSNGHEYVLDYDMSEEDCVRAMTRLEIARGQVGNWTCLVPYDYKNATVEDLASAAEAEAI